MISYSNWVEIDSILKQNELFNIPSNIHVQYLVFFIGLLNDHYFYIDTRIVNLAYIHNLSNTKHHIGISFLKIFMSLPCIGMW
jgi:hypothetical protein